METKKSTEINWKEILPLRVGGTMNINGDMMRRIDDYRGNVRAFVSDQNLVDGRERDEFAEYVVRVINAAEEKAKSEKKGLRS